MKTIDIIRFIHLEIQVLNSSLEKNSWEYCDDDETPDFEERRKDHAQIDAYRKVLKFINKDKQTITDEEIKDSIPYPTPISTHQADINVGWIRHAKWLRDKNNETK